MMGGVGNYVWGTDGHVPGVLFFFFPLKSSPPKHSTYVRRNYLRAGFVSFSTSSSAGTIQGRELFKETWYSLSSLVLVKVSERLSSSKALTAVLGECSLAE